VQPRMWETRVVALSLDPDVQQCELDEVALDGWRLISVDQQRAYFIRRGTVTVMPRQSAAPRCQCGEMTEAKAILRRHKCPVS
jgi:hypothetical protein